MVDIKFCRGALTAAEQKVVSTGFDAHGEEHGAPEYNKEHVDDFPKGHARIGLRKQLA